MNLPFDDDQIRSIEKIVISAVLWSCLKFINESPIAMIATSTYYTRNNSVLACHWYHYINDSETMDVFFIILCTYLN